MGADRAHSTTRDPDSDRSPLYDVRKPACPSITNETCEALFSRTIEQCRSIKPSGGARRDRTDDLMLAKHALSQLSYAPTGKDQVEQWWAREDLNFRPHAYQARALTN